jgi:hypothetical protein
VRTNVLVQEHRGTSRVKCLELAQVIHLSVDDNPLNSLSLVIVMHEVESSSQGHPACCADTGECQLQTAQTAQRARTDLRNLLQGEHLQLLRGHYGLRAGLK